MPSLWKKHRSGNRISPVVVDLQTRHKKNGSGELLLDDESSNKVSSTSLVDLFVKHKDKLKKPSKKKQRSKKHVTASLTTTLSIQDQTCPFPIFRTVGNQYATRSKLEVPTSSTHEKIQNAIIAHEKCDVSMNNDDCGTSSENSRIIFHRKNVFLTCILTSFLIMMGIAFYNKMFVLGITLGALFVFVLECVRNTTCWLFKDCEGSVVFLTISKGASIVVVAFYTKSFLIGILLGVLLLILSEFARKNIVRIFKPCEYAKDTLQDNDSSDAHMNGSKERSWNGNRDMVSNNEGVHSIVQNKDFRESVAFTKGFELQVCDDGEKLENRDRTCSNKKFEETNMDTILVNRISPIDEEKLRNKIISQIELLEQHNSVLTKQNQPNKSSPTRYHVQLGKIEVEEKAKIDVELSDDAIENEKAKKRRKFWKKLVPKHMRKKNKKYGNKHNNIMLEESFMEMEDTEITDKEESSTFSSSSDSNEDGEENLTDANCNYNEVFQANNDTKNYYETNNKNDNNTKYLTIMIIPLAGLISGRILAFVLTVICCVVFKLLRR